MTTLTKLMSGAALALILAVPATAQDAAAPDASAEQVPGGDDFNRVESPRTDPSHSPDAFA